MTPTKPPPAVQIAAAEKAAWLHHLPATYAARLECEVARYLHHSGCTGTSWANVGTAVLAHSNPGAVWAAALALGRRTGGPLPSCRMIREYHNIPPRRPTDGH